MIEVLAAGPMSTIQDLGRTGYTDVGVGRCGAADLPAHRLANRLVGNGETAATIEVTMGELQLRFSRAGTIAVTGADCGLIAAPRPVDLNAAISLPAGATVRLTAPRSGVRNYVAVRGGIAVEPVLGSRSTDTLSGVGPAQLRTGDRLPIGTDVVGEPADPVPSPRPSTGRISLVHGPRLDWFSSDARRVLVNSTWTVSPDSSRIGVRLSGPKLERLVQSELPSEPTMPGAIQVPPSGELIVLGPDAPVTGGYPVIAVVRAVDLSRFGQLRPTDTVTFEMPATFCR